MSSRLLVACVLLASQAFAQAEAPPAVDGGVPTAAPPEPGVIASAPDAGVPAAAAAAASTDGAIAPDAGVPAPAAAEATPPANAASTTTQATAPAAPSPTEPPVDTQASSTESVTFTAPPPAAPALTDRRLSVGARLGYALPFGHWTGNTRESRSGLLADVYSAVYPLQVDVAYRLHPLLAAGAYLQMAPASLQYSCVGGDCSARQFRAGAQLVFRPPTGTKWSVFVTPELGYDASDFSARTEDNAFHMDVSYRGFDLTLSVGADYPMNDKWRLGFFFFARGGTYLWLAVKIIGEGFEAVPNPSAHGFIGFGVRADYAVF